LSISEKPPTVTVTISASSSNRFSSRSFLVLRKLRSLRGAPVTTKLEISGNDIVILGPDSTVTMPWTDFRECQESPEVFVLLDRRKKMLLAIPKRAFPNASWQTWFREEAKIRLSLAQQPPTVAPALATSPRTDWVWFTVRLDFRDYFDRTTASWRTWGFLIAMTGLMLGVGAYSAANPPPDAVYSPMQVFFMFAIPVLLGMTAIVILVGSMYWWLSNIKHSAPQELAISEDSLVFSGADASGALAWTAFTRYKETPWSFILWKPGGAAWVMFPKRAFASPDDLRRCRGLLERHLVKSRWFLGN
jgi:YcxB-like protein